MAKTLGHSRCVCMAIAFALNLAGCKQYPLVPAQANDSAIYKTAPRQDDPGAPLIGLALSGGGNRSAVYASYVIELLGSVPVLRPAAHEDESFLNEARYISSVSGGGFAAAYFGMISPGAGNPAYIEMITAPTVTHIYNGYFDRFHAAMITNWESGMVTSLVTMPFAGSNSNRLTKSIEESFLGKEQTFLTLYEREKNGGPYLIFNATNYNNGRRFAMTTIPQDDFCIDINKLVIDVARNKGISSPSAVKQAIEVCQQSPFTPDGFDSIQGQAKTYHTDPSKIPLAQAVATSGAFPFFIGPIPYTLPDYPGYLHLADGGLADNSGVESIAQLFLKKMASNTTQHGLILEINAGFPFDSAGSRVIDQDTPVGALAKDPSRLSDIQEMRASNYRSLLWELAQLQLFGDNNKKHPATSVSANPVGRLEIIQFTHTEILEGLSDDSTKAIKVVVAGHSYDASTLRERLTNLQTEYKVEPEEQDLLRIAACWSVHRHAKKIQAFFTELSPGVQPSNARTVVDVDTRVGVLCPELSDALRLPLTQDARLY